MLPWASPLKGLLSRQRDHRTVHRYQRRSAVPVRRFRVETRLRGRGVLGRRCLRGPRPDPAGEPARLHVRASLTEPPSWLASCPAGCPAGVRMPPTRPAPAPEGVSTRGPTPGTTSSGLSVSCSRGDPVSRPSMSPFAPEGSFSSTFRVRGRSWPSGTPARGHASPVHRRRASPWSATSRVSGGPTSAGPSSRQAEALTRGAGPQSEALRPVLVPPSSGSSSPGGVSERGVGSPTGVGLLWGPSSTVTAEAARVAVAKLGTVLCAVQPALVSVSSDPQGIFRPGPEDSKA